MKLPVGSENHGKGAFEIERHSVQTKNQWKAVAATMRNRLIETPSILIGYLLKQMKETFEDDCVILRFEKCSSQKGVSESTVLNSCVVNTVNPFICFLFALGPLVWWA